MKPLVGAQDGVRMASSRDPACGGGVHTNPGSVTSWRRTPCPHPKRWVLLGHSTAPQVSGRKGVNSPGIQTVVRKRNRAPFGTPDFSRACLCFVKENTAETGQDGPARPGNFCPHVSPEKDQGNGGSLPAEARGPSPRSQIFHQGSIQGLCPLAPATQRQLPCSGHLILSPPSV